MSNCNIINCHTSKINNLYKNLCEVKEDIKSIDDKVNSNIQTMWFSVFPDQSTSPDSFEFVGINKIANNGVDLINQTTNITTNFGVGNNHLAIMINNINNPGSITITGTSISELNGIPVENSTEILNITTSLNQLYQTSKKWLEITDIEISNSIDLIDYDVIILGYMDIGNRDFIVSGYRLEAISGSKTALEFIINKIQDDGNGKCSIVPLEDISINTTQNTGPPSPLPAHNSIYDNLRNSVVTSDRSYTMNSGEIWRQGTEFVFKQDDFTDYFDSINQSGRNIIEASSKDEGLIILIKGTVGAPDGTPYIRLQIRYNYL